MIATLKETIKLHQENLLDQAEKNYLQILKNNPNFKFLKPYIIAEIGSNFNQSIDLAFKLISSAKNAGADAVKFQLFNAKKMYPNDKKMFSLFKSIELNKNWIPKLKKF